MSNWCFKVGLRCEDKWPTDQACRESQGRELAGVCPELFSETMNNMKRNKEQSRSLPTVSKIKRNIET